VTSLQPIYHGHTGESSARFRPASQPPGYCTAKGTAGHYLGSPEDTGGRFSLYRWDMSSASGGPGPHFHRTYDETFYILAGTIRLYDGTRWLDATPGDMLHVPAGGIHGFTNASRAPASMLMLLTPGADRAAYFSELAAIADSGRELSDAEWDEVFARHDNVMLPGHRAR
jgi:mannose-6-phosphate isomerase-like protein (cupin superfamily)